MAVLPWLGSGKEGTRGWAGHGGNNLVLTRDSVGGLDVVAHSSILAAGVVADQVLCRLSVLLVVGESGR